MEPGNLSLSVFRIRNFYKTVSVNKVCMVKMTVLLLLLWFVSSFYLLYPPVLGIFHQIPEHQPFASRMKLSQVWLKSFEGSCDSEMELHDTKARREEMNGCNSVNSEENLFYAVIAALYSLCVLGYQLCLYIHRFFLMGIELYKKSMDIRTALL